MCVFTLVYTCVNMCVYVYLNSKMIYMTDVKKFPMLVDRMKVPARETTYMCQFFKFPTDATYDVIASEPIIENTATAHHLVVLGCDKPGG